MSPSTMSAAVIMTGAIIATGRMLLVGVVELKSQAAHRVHACVFVVAPDDVHLSPEAHRAVANYIEGWLSSVGRGSWAMTRIPKPAARLAKASPMRPHPRRARVFPWML